MQKSFPNALKKGGTIGIVSPGSWCDPDTIAKGQRFLESQGYPVRIHAQNYLHSGQLAGDDNARAAAVMDMFQDPSIDAVMCARGGNGTIRLLDKLDYNVIKKNPKIFIGYSDITLLLHAISKMCGFTTYHGPMLTTFGGAFDAATAHDCFAALERVQDTLTLKPSQAECVVAGDAQGILIGGNMTQLEALIATRFDRSWKDAILFIEDVDEVLYRIDRLLQHFRLAGKLEGLKGVIVGEMIDVPDGETSHMRPGERPYGRTLIQILTDALPSPIPICHNFPCGHGSYITTFPIGAQAVLTTGPEGCNVAIALRSELS